MATPRRDIFDLDNEGLKVNKKLSWKQKWFLLDKWICENYKDDRYHDGLHAVTWAMGLINLRSTLREGEKNENKK